MSCLFEDLADDETVDINCSGRTFIRLFCCLTSSRYKSYGSSRSGQALTILMSQ